MFSFDNTSEVIEFTRLYLALFYSYVAIFYFTRILILKKTKTVDVVFTGERFCSIWWNQMAFRFFRFSIWLVCFLRFYFPSIDAYLGMMTSLERVPIILSGDLILTCGFLLIITIHISLGSKWRSGIDPKKPDQLITDGFYQYSRNPIFMSIALCQLGFFLALPSVFSLLCLVIGLSVLHRQTLSEERNLAKKFPDEYQTYSSKVQRWL